METCEDLRSGEQMIIGYDTLVGADGASSKARLLLSGRKQRNALSLQGTVGLADLDFVFGFRPVVQGYCWCIPMDVEASVGCMLYDDTTTECRAWIETFCEELGVGAPKLRGAPIPTGDDVLLHAGTDVWLIGDAAGLVRSRDGGESPTLSPRLKVLPSRLPGEPRTRRPCARGREPHADGSHEGAVVLCQRPAHIPSGSHSLIVGRGTCIRGGSSPLCEEDA